MPKRKSAFTLLELLVVILIIGIIAAIAWPNYIAMKEHEHDREAAANLRLIMAAEKVYRMETNLYYDAGDTTGVNDNLRLALPTGTTAIWGYKTVVDNTSDPKLCCTQADRTTAGGGSARSLRLRNTDDPNQDLTLYSGACP
ncbi:MAG: prepilin-type N-terminal cleavage/methylation domain-containing protein [Candidatus Omnitrophica bacterium]|nr:prepilin-type N-terminal cleavage/methylation domain-containing protein [Candidatus Omnitrophota bacterium]